ncbi:MAG: ABC transporter ATP-binding protein [Clostridia bacterium]|nr:ABC transporter ATP-binding protein [Clostridia bacterium]
MIEVIDLQKNYETKTALKGISFKVNQGEIFGFLGPNGAGKTTTLKILTGNLLPSYGTARVMGFDTICERTKIQKDMGIVPENANLYERLSIYQNLLFFCNLYGSDKKNIDHYLEQVGLLKEKNTQVKKLSKGMKQRVLLVRALIHEPKVLFLDEPTSGLDPASSETIHKMLSSLNEKGITILLTSHNMEEVDRLCHRVAFLDGGSIVADGSPSALKLKYSDHKMKVLYDESGVLKEKLLSLSGEESAKCMAVWLSEGKVKSVHSCEPTLSDIFVKVTGRDFV